MKSKIIIFISLIAYILSDVSILSVATGACKDKKYTFVIKANSNADLAAGSATVKLASPESTTPTCTFEAVSTTSSGGGSSSGDSGSSTGGGSSSGDSGSSTGGGSSSGDSGSTTGGGSSSGDSGSTTGGRRLATGDFDITCVITSKLDNADIKVQSVAITSVTVSAATGVTYPLSINEKATCEGTASSDSSTPDGDKFIQISGFLFLLILTVF
jgi:hypothetical protein